MKLQAPRGTFDVMPGDARRRLRLQRDADDVLGRAGYEPFETPIFEDTELFARGVGEATDIVQKEMFTFEDKAGRSLTLRPEATAAMCREYIERAGAGPARLRVSSLGTPETRAEYLEELRLFLRAREGELSEEVRERLDQNPLRAFDADHPGTQAVMEEAPRLLERLEAEDAQHFAHVRALLDAAGMEYEVDSTLVRGLDYYTRTVFEFESERLGAQAALGGGGRYDRLIEELGGPPTPANGWAAGIERILLAADSPDEPAPRIYLALAKPDAVREAFALARRLREEGIRVEMEQAGRSMKGQIKHADRIGARATVIVGDAIEVKDMDSGKQSPADGADDALARVRELLA